MAETKISCGGFFLDNETLIEEDGILKVNGTLSDLMGVLSLLLADGWGGKIVQRCQREHCTFGQPNIQSIDCFLTARLEA